MFVVSLLMPFHLMLLISLLILQVLLFQFVECIVTECTLETGLLATGEGREVCVIHPRGAAAWVGFVARGGGFQAEKVGFAFGRRTNYKVMSKWRESVCLQGAYLNRIAASTAKVVKAPRKFQMPLRTKLPTVLVMIWSRRIPYKSKNAAKDMRQMPIIITTARIYLEKRKHVRKEEQSVSMFTLKIPAWMLAALGPWVWNLVR